MLRSAAGQVIDFIETRRQRAASRRSRNGAKIAGFAPGRVASGAACGTSGLPSAILRLKASPMPDARFRPFETHLDEDRALAVLREAVAGADDGELFLERRRSEVLAFDDGRLKTASYDAGEGFGLRAVSGPVIEWAFCGPRMRGARQAILRSGKLARYQSLCSISSSMKRWHRGCWTQARGPRRLVPPRQSWLKRPGWNWWKMQAFWRRSRGWWNGLCH